jgi:hypothetical protein
MFACAVESYSVRSPTHYAKTNQFPPPPFLQLPQPNMRYFRRYLNHYLLTDKQELWGKNTTIYMKQANNLIRPCGG